MFSKTAQYTFRIVIYVAQDSSKLFSAQHIHENINIPYKYLTMLMTKLAKAQILKVHRGRNGGFALNRQIDQINLIDILDAIGENDCSNCALGNKACEEDRPCPMHETFSPSKRSLEEMLNNTTLDLLDANLL